MPTLRLAIVSCVGIAWLGACAGDDSNPATGGQGTVGTTSTTHSRTDTTGDSTLPLDSTTAAADSTTIFIPASSSDSTTGLATETETDGTTLGSSDTTTGSVVDDGWGDCANNEPDAVCLAQEDCLVDDAMAPTAGVCAWIGCMVAADCPMPPPGGNAPVACGDVTGDGVAQECFIDCSAAQQCPTGMACLANALCAWPTQSPGGTSSGGASSGGMMGIPGGTCCTDNGAPGCNVMVIETCVCTVDPFCCSNTWDGLCADQAIADCDAQCP